MSRAAKAQPCPRCGAPTLTGLDFDACALTVTVDPTPLTRRQELACVVVGRQVYGLDSWRELTHRDARVVLLGPAKTVVAEHICGQPIPEPTPEPDGFFIYAEAAHTTDDTPPF